MSTTRRAFPRQAGIVGGAALVVDGSFRVAAADRPINFAGWVFKPDTVKDYVELYNKKSGGQVKYEAIPWAQYHPTTRRSALGDRRGIASEAQPLASSQGRSSPPCDARPRPRRPRAACCASPSTGCRRVATSRTGAGCYVLRSRPFTTGASG